MGAEIFEALRALDDHDEPRSLAFSGSGLLMWPFVRWSVMTAGQEAALGVSNIGIAGARRSPRERVAQLGRAMLRGPMVARAFDHVVIGTSAGTVVQREGRWFDRINDYFVMEDPAQSLVLEMAPYKTPRVPPHVRCYETFDLQAGIAARLVRPRDADLARIAQLAAFVARHVPSVDVMPALVHWAVRLPVLRHLWARFFDRVQPRILFIEGGGYGNFAHLCTWAAERGITTAEFQHGLISRTHLAYNYGDRSALAQSLPRYLLLYGEVWTQELRTPSEPVVVGSPHFAETARPAHGGDATLVISQGYCTELMVRATEALARRGPVIFRPHPGELPFRAKYEGLGRLPNVELAERGDLYALLARARAVVGHSSTALLEAAGVGLPVFIFDDALSRATLPASVGTWVKTVDELAATPARTAFAADAYFARDWRERYRAFLSTASARARHAASP